MLKMILTDKYELPIEDISITGATVAVFATQEEFVEAWKHLTPDNLYSVLIANDDTVLRTMHSVTIDTIQIVTNPDTTITAHFYLCETVTGNATTDADYVQAAKILLGEEGSI